MPCQCAKCSKEMENQQGYDYNGYLYCEDCYMDALSPPKACDPWAVHSARTFLKGKDKLATLTLSQLTLVKYIEEKGEAAAEDIMKSLDMTDDDFRREFAALRHMEILKATKRGDRVFYLLF
jgi:hypothetical protein